MDLADIRKKARDGKLGRQAPAAVPAAESVVPPPSSERTDRSPVPPPTASPAAPSAPTVERDPLAELFEFRGGFVPATEENYLAGLEKDAADAGEALRQWLTLSLGSETYALDIGQVSEIIKPREVTEIPRTPEFVLGLISLRGVIVPIFDLGRRLRLAPAVLGPAARIVVCHAEGRRAGLLVDCINQVVKLPEDSIEPPPAVLSGLDRDLLTGVGRHQERMLILLHLPSVLNAELVL